MKNKRTSGILGMVVGGGWLLWNLRYFKTQGFVAIGMPLIITALGAYYFFTSSDES